MDGVFHQFGNVMAASNKAAMETSSSAGVVAGVATGSGVVGATRGAHRHGHNHSHGHHNHHHHRPPQTAQCPPSARRRTRSTGSLPWLTKNSGESSSSMGEWEVTRDVGMSSLYQSDSDDIMMINKVMQVKRGLFNLQPPRLFPNIESDSVNENFSPARPITRRSRGLLKVLHRKRKLKRMAVMEVDVGSSAQTSANSRPLLATKKKRILRHCENSLWFRYCSWATSGKRKRSCARLPSGSGGCASGSVPTQHHQRAPNRTVLALHRLTLRDNAPTQSDPPPNNNNNNAHHKHPNNLLQSSSSLSSSESDTGIYTNDEGREGDDEQSDWVGEASGGGRGGGGSGGGLGGGGEGGSAEDDDDDDEDDDDMEDMAPPPGAASAPPLSQVISSRGFPSSLSHLALPHNHHDRLGGSGREIRGGRRRVRSDRAGFSILTSANEQLSRFLRDPAKSQLRLHPMREQERHQLGHLADLYSLDMHLTDLTCPVLTKTSNTMRAEPPIAMSRLHIVGHTKRRRRTPPKMNLSGGQQDSSDTAMDKEGDGGALGAESNEEDKGAAQEDDLKMVVSADPTC